MRLTPFSRQLEADGFLDTDTSDPVESRPPDAQLLSRPHIATEYRAPRADVAAPVGFSVFDRGLDEGR
jgi:hypothetical protein